ncbi:hypothetical protein [Sphingomonas sp. SORGH_AS_0438]|uniref:hypothetical protein n=1 Tax=Sphingomonas sp. SORGH_AS_0438 TaxID=3041756 RepID=UPI002856A2FB|nr:hypothetical protein [Sphingomonas sp. SORGH_AS_0438]MDR6127124.1 hypothetical protein [Sphingomonas sp. SORGH_AS_0438]
MLLDRVELQRGGDQMPEQRPGGEQRQAAERHQLQQPVPGQHRHAQYGEGQVADVEQGPPQRAPLCQRDHDEQGEALQDEQGGEAMVDALVAIHDPMHERRSADDGVGRLGRRG